MAKVLFGENNEAGEWEWYTTYAVKYYKYYQLLDHQQSTVQLGCTHT